MIVFSIIPQKLAYNMVKFTIDAIQYKVTRHAKKQGNKTNIIEKNKSQ